MNQKAIHVPSCAGEKSRRLYFATIKGGVVKVSGEGGKFVWIFEKATSFIRNDGVIFDACDFVEKAAAALKIRQEDVFSLENEDIQDIARQLAGIHPIASKVVCEAGNGKK